MIFCRGRVSATRRVATGLLITFVLAMALNFCLSLCVFAQPGSDREQWKTEQVGAGVVEAPALYYFGLSGGERFWHLAEDFRAGVLYASLCDLLVVAVDGLSREALSGLSEAELIIVAYENNVTYYVTDFSALSEQVWAVGLETEPGGQGQLGQKIEAAYGSYMSPTAGGSGAGSEQSEFNDGWWFVNRQGLPLSGLLRAGDDVIVKSGRKFVGDYFTLKQFASTTGGLSKRYISISSPWSLGFVHEDARVAGKSVIRDTFMMINIEPGRVNSFDWLELF
jgi:hypothetical protein